MVTKLLLALLLACACLSLPANEPEFSYLAPTWQENAELPPSLRCIEARLARDHDLRAEDLITWAHEGTHYLDARHSQSPVRAFYCLRGRIARFRNPRVSLTQIARATPVLLRGNIYNTYLAAQDRLRAWDDDPLYVVHEWVAYTNGSQVRKELAWEKRGETLAHMAEMGVYVSVLVNLIETQDPAYDLGPLVTFVRWNAARGKEIAGTQWNGLPAFVKAAEQAFAPALDLMDLVKRSE
jgi:hypothetical protein